jgi:hypothetical protein
MKIGMLMKLITLALFFYYTSTIFANGVALITFVVEIINECRGITKNNKRIASLSFFHGCRKRRIEE